MNNLNIGYILMAITAMLLIITIAAIMRDAMRAAKRNPFSRKADMMRPPRVNRFAPDWCDNKTQYDRYKTPSYMRLRSADELQRIIDELNDIQEPLREPLEMDNDYVPVFLRSSSLQSTTSAHIN